MKECRYCHAENEDTAQYCSACGAEFAAETEQAQPIENNDGIFTKPPKPEGKKTCGFAIAALVLGALGFLFGFNVTLGILAIVFAGIAFGQIKRENKGGKGLAVAGLVFGILTVALGVLTLVILFTDGFQRFIAELGNELSQVPAGEFSDLIGNM